MRKVVADSETDGLLPTCTKVWCVALRDVTTGEKWKFDPTQLRDFRNFADTVDHWIGHNFLSFDSVVFRRFLDLHIPVKKITDTLIKSRLQYYTRPGGHSLDNLGKLVHRPKIEFSDFTKYTPEMMTYCEGDVDTNYHVYIYLLQEGKRFGSPEAERLEHGVQYLLNQQQEYGFP
jgi:DNA polymerase-1